MSLVKTLTYERTFNLGKYQSERIGATADLDEDDDAEGTQEDLRIMVRNMHAANQAAREAEAAASRAAAVAAGTDDDVPF